MNKLAKLSLGAMALTSALLVTSCGHPGGLSDAEWNSISPARRAELTMQQSANIERQVHDSQENAHWDKQDKASGNKWDNEAKKDMQDALKKTGPINL